MNSTRPASSSRRSLSRWAAPDSIAVCVSWPQACMHPSTCDAKSSPVSSGIGSASMSPRRMIVGPGAEPSSRATMPLVDSCVVTDNGRPSSDDSTCSRVIGRSLPSSGHSCNRRRRATASSRRSAACSRTDSTIGSCSCRSGSSRSDPCRSERLRAALIGWLPWMHRRHSVARRRPPTLRSHGAIRTPDDTNGD